jgi:hypothetical protein
MAKPIWLLDIDGVINSVTSTPATDVWPDWIRTVARDNHRTWPIQTATAVRDFITRIHTEGLAEIRWHTTWQKFAPRVGKAVGLPEFPVQEVGDEYDPWRYRYSEWKPPAVFRVAATGVPVLWTDDDIAHITTADQRVKLTEMGVHLVEPDSWLGLQQRDLDSIEEFLQTCREEADDDT